MALLRTGLKTLNSGRQIIQFTESSNVKTHLRQLTNSQIKNTSCGGPAGRCGIPPLEKKEVVKKEKVVVEMPAHLIAPPCIPNAKQSAKFPPLCSIHEGIECPQTPLKYKYPAYSECCKREGKIRRIKECCYYPPPNCEIQLVQDETTK
uniref:Uncharacterized protein n=1 Tax=Clastoptera arizonana TaxID=38151 RepID=A0A1B6E5R4_9HEMI